MMNLELYQQIKSQTNFEIDELKFMLKEVEDWLNIYENSDNKIHKNSDGEHLTDFSKQIGDLESKRNMLNEIIADVSERAETEYLSTRQRILIFHYLFKYLNIDEGTDLKGQKLKNVEFIIKVLGLKGLEKPKDSYTNKVLKNPLNQSPKQIQEIRNLFESIGLNEIAEIINKDLKI